MAIPYLPKLREIQPGEPGLELSLPGQAGAWNNEQGPRRMSMLADAIEVPPGADRVHSIPDPWARAILFWRALLDPGHSLHEQIVGEWRGLLGVIAMRYVRNFHQLATVQVRLGRQPGNGAEDEEVPGGSFRAVLEKVLPSNQNAIAPEASWRHFHLLQWQGDRTQGLARAFALTSPLTLVATGADCSEVLTTDEVPWFIDGRLTDPGEFLHTPHKALFAEWLQHVARGLPTGSGTRSRPIIELLRQFAAGLDKSKKGTDPRTAVFATRSIGLSGVDLYKDISLPCVAPIEVLSHCGLRGSVEGPAYLIVIDRAIPETLGRPPQDVAVYHTLTADRVRRELPDLAKQRPYGHFTAGTDGIPGAEWCTADFFFEKDLIYEQNRPLGGAVPTEAFPGCKNIRSEGNADYRHFALPIREEALNWLTARELIERLSVTWLPNGDARFELRLTLDTLVMDEETREAGTGEAGGAGNRHPSIPQPKAVQWANTPFDVVLERVYGREDRIRVELLPALCLWPNFRFEDETPTHEDGRPLPPTNRWTRYYLFESWRGGTDTSQMMVYAHKGKGAESRTTRLRAHSEQASEDPFKITLLNRFPEVLVCTMPSNKRRPANRSDSTPSGLLILQQPEPVQPGHGGKHVLGVDFGTTGTTIYAIQNREADGGGEGDPERLTFENRLIQITGWDSNALQRLTRELFLPNAQPAFGRILTVFQDFGAEAQPKAVMDGHVLFLENSGLQNFVHGHPNSIRTSLKWGQNPRDNIAASNFLVQLCVQSLAELVVRGSSEVELRYSYPTAFSSTDLNRFLTNWSIVQREMRGSTSIRVEVPSSLRSEDLQQFCEAICATQFFSHSSNDITMDPGQGAITLDIGGGSTDIAVWNQHPETRNPSLLAHTSIKFAGQDIFLAPLRQRPDLLAQIDDGGDVTRAIERLKKNFSRQESKNAYYAELDAIISSYSDGLLNQLPPFAESRGIKELLNLIQFGLSGVAFYAGLILGSLVRDGTYRHTRSDQPLTVFVGGNGSRLFHWCQLGVRLEDSDVIRTFTNALLGGAAFAMGSPLPSDEVLVILSSRPKEEVAFGLVRETAEIFINDKYVQRIMGEGYFVGTSANLQQKTWDTPLDLSVLVNEPVDVDPDMPVFRAFLASIGEEPTAEEIRRAASAVNAELRQMAKEARNLAREAKAAQLGKNKTGKNVDPFRRQPLFVLALNSFVSDKVQEIASLPVEAQP